MSWDAETEAALIDMIIEPGVRSLNDSARFNAQKADYDEGHLFYRIADRVERVYRNLEAGMSACESSRGQVATLIEEQLGYLMVDDRTSMRTCFHLGLGGWSNTWSDEQTSYARAVNDLFELGVKEYFLSFTGRAPANLNARHSGLFMSRFSSGLYRAEKNRKNLLAKAIEHIFESVPLHGYYYHDAEDDNRLLTEELARECERCLVLVQIIQKAMFQGDPAGNVCLQEFESFRQGLAARLIGVERAIKFVLGEGTFEDIANLHPVPPPYREWHDAVTEKKVMLVPPSDTDAEFSASVRAAREQIEGLARQVEDTRKRLWLGVPE